MTPVRSERVTAPLKLSPWFYRLTRWVAGQTFQRYYRLEVAGLEHWPREGPVILCPRHQRWEDIPVVGLTFPRPLYFIAKVELFRSWLGRAAIGALGGVPLDRDRPQATLSSFRSLHTLLGRGEHLVLFPEGTYVPGGVGPGKHRLIQLLLKAQGGQNGRPLPFVPIGICYRPDSPGYRVRVQVGRPLTVPYPTQAAALTDDLMAAMARLCE